MSKVFNQKPAGLDKINRNTFDKSFKVAGSFGFGTLYPVYVKPVIAGESVSITPSIGLRFLPMVFPTMTDCNVYMHFFYCRNRAAWKNWEDWLTMANDVRPNGHKKNYTFPYINVTDDKLRTGLIFDWMGLPTTFATQNVVPQILAPNLFVGRSRPSDLNVSTAGIQASPLAFTSRTANEKIFIKAPGGAVVPYYGGFFSTALKGSISPGNLNLKTIGLADGSHSFKLLFNASRPSVSGSEGSGAPLVGGYFGEHGTLVVPADRFYTITGTVTSGNMTITLTAEQAAAFNVAVDNGKRYLSIWSTEFSDESVLPQSSATDYKSFGEISFPVKVASVVDAVEMGVNPFKQSGATAPAIMINAIPFRHAEACYNAYYRNQQVDPFELDGVFEYDKFCADGDGLDNQVYKLHVRNWEQDQFTTMLPSPQMGSQPLAALSTSATDLSTLTFDLRQPLPQVDTLSSDSTPSQKAFTFKPVWQDEDVSTGRVVGFECDDEDVPLDLLNIVRSARIGLTMNDIRDASALTRFLEARIRTGYRYKDAMSDVYGTDISYDKLLMPEFIGGTSDTVSVNMLTQSAETAEKPLGSWAGTASCMSGNNHSITCFCEEHGYIIGFLSIVPKPSYSQALRKDLIVPDSPLSFYNPAFANIGYQPVLAREITPLQRAAEPGKKQTEIIGYQRPWYENMINNDEIHGLMRTDFLGFNITRIFGSTPKLSPQFIQLRAENLTSPFADADMSEDIAMGVVDFQVHSKLPIPMFANPHVV